MKKKLYANNLVSLIYQVCAVIIGLILPRLILRSYGSEINGVVNSITQMLSVISLLDLGVGAVVQSALYKPLYEKDNLLISKIYNSAKKYFSRIAQILVVYIVILCGYYGFAKNNAFSWIFTTSLIISISISFFSQYYFGICNTLLLNADQKIYIVTIVNLLGLIANAIITVILLQLNASIQIVKLVSSTIYLLKPLILHLYVKRNYTFQKQASGSVYRIPNQWSGLAQHITVVVTNSIDNIALTMFSTFSVVSIYNIYVMPLNSIRTLFDVTSNSYKSFFGNLLARDDREKLQKEFKKYEMVMHYIIMIIFLVTLNTLIPFVLIYTSGVNDVNYKLPLFGMIITLAYAMYTLRLPYTNLIFAAGKFKETQKYCIVECILNMVISFGLIHNLGVVGVAIGTVVSSAYRMIVSAYYLTKDIVYTQIKDFVKHIFVDIICIVSTFPIFNLIYIEVDNFGSWIVLAIVSMLVSIVTCSIVYGLAYYEIRKFIMNKIGRR